MRKNVAGQHVAGQVNSRTDGSPLTSSVSVFVTIDGGTQTAGGGTAAHEGNGHWDYAPTQAETNGNHLAFTFTHATGVNQTVNVYPVSFDPHDTVGLGLSRLDAAVSSRSSHSAADIWSVATRLLTAGTNIVLAKGAGVTGFTDLDAVGVRSAVGLASANLDTQLGDLPTAAEIADAVWDELLATHLGVGATGLALNTASLNISLDAAATRAALGMAAANLDTQLGGLPTATEIRSEIDTNSTKLDAAVSTRLASASYTAPDNASITAIKAETDKFLWTGDYLKVDNCYVNGVLIGGAGTAGSPFGPA